MADIPNLAGVVTKDLVDTIGSGSFKASYVNWSRTLNLLRQHAPGWMPETLAAQDGSLVHRAPVGGYLMIRFVHADGTETPAVPQSIMDSRNSAIAFEKITARDITDTQRRGTCLAACYFFGLAFELWAKMPIESGYGDAQPSVPLQQDAPKAVTGKVSKASSSATEDDFRKAAFDKGLCKDATIKLIGVIKGNYEKGIKTLESKDDSWVLEQNAPFLGAANTEAW